jgi:hypothetical protein
MEPDRIAAAVALAIELSGQERLVAADRPVTAPWLRECLDAIPYERPSGKERTWFVLLHPATMAVRIATSNDIRN